MMPRAADKFACCVPYNAPLGAIVCVYRRNPEDFAVLVEFDCRDRRRARMSEPCESRVQSPRIFSLVLHCCFRRHAENNFVRISDIVPVQLLVGMISASVLDDVEKPRL